MSKIKDIFLVIRKMYNYFTIWVLTLSLLYYLGEFEDYYIDLLILHLLISIISFNFVYIHPKRLIVDLGVRKFNLEGNILRILDVLFHHLPFILFLVNKGKIKKSYLLITLPFIYRLFYDPEKIYGIKDITALMIYFFCLSIYLFY